MQKFLRRLASHQLPVGCAPRRLSVFILWVAVALAYLPAPSLAAEPKVLVTTDNDVVTATHNGRPCVHYCTQPSPNKPFLKSLRSPGGFEVLLNEVADHSHHHGLMFALGVDETNFWHEDDRRAVIGASIKPRQSGKQIPHRAPPNSVQALPPTGSTVIVDQMLTWTGENEHPLADERRIICLDPETSPTPVSILTWRTDLAPAEGQKSITLWGAPYFGMGLRLARDLDGRGEFRSAANRPAVRVRDGEMLRYGKWCAYTVSEASRTLTVVLFDHPKNSRPAVWFTMNQPFAFLSATLAIDKDVYELKAGQTLRLCYGVAVADRSLSDDDIGDLYGGWLKGMPLE